MWELCPSGTLPAGTLLAGGLPAGTLSVGDVAGGNFACGRLVGGNFAAGHGPEAADAIFRPTVHTFGCLIMVIAITSRILSKSESSKHVLLLALYKHV